mmetsp:Transcript_129413/g.335614  ORF Transcript_129413/g.335614 Transcript_129413/m.335614 type:complete len:83 (-) Transcript_129413:1437-1685(-)
MSSTASDGSAVADLSGAAEPQKLAEFAARLKGKALWRKWRGVSLETGRSTNLKVQNERGHNSTMMVMLCGLLYRNFLYFLDR